jgi:hypothetical protein
MSDIYFPEAKSAEILGELSAWTSVADILVAARILEARPVQRDRPERLLLMPLEHPELEFKQIFEILLGYLMKGYVVPYQKIAVCLALDPQITDATRSTLLSLRFRPTVHVGMIPTMQNKPAFFIQDHPAVIELLQSPLKCLMGLYLNKYEFSKSLRNIILETEQLTRGRPGIFHRPYADGCLPSFIEAVCFYALGLEVGTQFASPGRPILDIAYRAVNIQTHPPVDPVMLGATFQASQRMLDALR